VKIPAVLLLLLATAMPAAAQDAAAAQAANNFYTVLRAQGGSDGIPGPSLRAALLPLMSDRLGKLLLAANDAQTRFRMQNRFAPPLAEGDLFSSLLEGPTGFKVGACTGTPAAQRCRIQFHRAKPVTVRGQAQPMDWNDDLLLVQEQGGWRVDDVDYRGGFPYGNAGLLSQTLGMITRAAGR
jgi:hypothetical protein